MEKFNPIIGVYAICKNESKFVKDWLKNIWNDGNGADYIAVLDTGSEDNTLKLFQETIIELNIPEDRFIIKSDVVTPWRFDVARNKSLDLLKSFADNVNVFYCIDLDEKVIPEFWSDLKNTATEHPDFDRIYYRYAWSHNETTGEPEWVFWYDKIHNASYEWQYPVHEALYNIYNDKSYEDVSYRMPKEKIYLHHYADPTKSRSSYLALLEMRKKEYPDDIYGLYYLAREYGFNNMTQEEFNTWMLLYYKLFIEKNIFDDMGISASVCCHIAKLLSKYDCSEEDVSAYYKKAIQVDPFYQEAYIRFAQFLAYKGKFNETYEILKDMHKNCVVYREDWKTQAFISHLWKELQIIAVAKCWEGQYKEAKSYFEKAEENINELAEQDKAISEGFYADFNWLTDYLKNKKEESLNNDDN